MIDSLHKRIRAAMQDGSDTPCPLKSVDHLKPTRSPVFDVPVELRKQVKLWLELNNAGCPPEAPTRVQKLYKQTVASLGILIRSDLCVRFEQSPERHVDFLPNWKFVFASRLRHKDYSM